jgi:hypothetical protein
MDHIQQANADRIRALAMEGALCLHMKNLHSQPLDLCSEPDCYLIRREFVVEMLPSSEATAPQETT